MITKIEHFTAAIQLITAVNFTFILTHLPKCIFKQILGYDLVCREKFKKFRAIKLGGIANDINNMKNIVIDGVETSRHKNKLTSKVDRIIASWDFCEEKSVSIINRLCKAKGFKCLFLFISVYCVFDLIAIPSLNLWSNDYLITLISLINLFAIFHTLRLSWIILHSKWDAKPDRECYNRTIVFLAYTFLGIIPVWFLANFLPNIQFNENLRLDAVVVLKGIWEFDIWSCLLLPFYPYVFSMLYVLGAILVVNVMRCYHRVFLTCRIYLLERNKRKYDEAYATLTNVDWGE